MKRGWILAGLVLGQAGCPTFPDDGYFYREGFQDCPTGCGWMRIAGAADNVIIADTLPGERGLQLRDEVTVSHTLEGVMFDSANRITGERLALDAIVRCDVGARLDVQIAGTDELGMPQAFTPVLSLEPNWDRPRPSFSALRGFSSADPALVSLDTIVLTKTGRGVCEVDEIGILLNQFRFTD